VRAVVGIRQSPDPSPELSSSADFVLESVRSLQAV
jgi:hypothetical protein